MVSKAADAAVWEDLKDIKPPTYDGNPLNLDRFLEKLDDQGVTVTEDMDPADAEKYVFKRFRYRLPEVLQELYFGGDQGGENQDPQGSEEVAQRAGAGGRSAGGCQAVEGHQASA